MTRFSFKYLCLLLLLFGSGFLNGQSSEYIVRQFTTENGLPHNVCYEVMEDKYGNVWIGTDNGLARYTSQGIEVFSEEDGLSGPYIIELEEYRGDTILISNWKKGLDYYVNGEFGSYNPYFTGKRLRNIEAFSDAALMRSYNGFYLISSKGIHKYGLDEEYKLINEFNYENSHKAIVDYLLTFEADKSLTVFNRGNAVTIREGKAPKINENYTFLKGKQPSCLTTLLNGKGKWIGFESGYIALKEQGSKGQLIYLGDVYGSYNIVQISAIDDEDALLLAFFDSRLTEREVFLYDKSQKNVIPLIKKLNFEGLPAAVELSRKKELWIATDGQGTYTAKRNPFNHYGVEQGIQKSYISQIDQDFEGHIYLLAKGGVYGKPKDSIGFAEIEGYEHATLISFGKNNIQQKVYLSGDRNSPVMRQVTYQNRRFQLKKLEIPRFHKYINLQNAVLTTNNEAIRYYFRLSEEGVNDRDTVHNYYQCPYTITDIVKSNKDSRIWMATWNGVYQFAPMSAVQNVKYSFKNDNHYGFEWGNWGFSDSIKIAQGLPSNRINDVVYDSKGSLWIATAEGLVKWSEQERKVLQIYTVSDGLIANDIQSIAIDSLDRVWVGTSKGVSRVSKDGVISFNASNGLLSDDVNCVFIDPDQNLWIGGSQGASMLDLKKNDYQRSLAQLRCLTFTINGRDTTLQQGASFDFGARVSLKVVNDGHELSRIQYSINGEEWQELPTGQLDFLSLGDDSYEVRIRAKLLNSYWSEPLVLEFDILPPFWRSWQAFLGYFLLATVIAIVLFRVYVRRQKRLQASKLQEVENSRLKELNTFKSRFFDNISHEFRTPLTLISGVNEELLPEMNKKQGKLLNISQRNVDSLLDLINQLLALSKIQDSSMKLNLGMHDFNAEIQRVIENFEILAASKNVKLDAKFSREELFFSFDAWKLGIVLNNLLSNAFKFTPEEGKVSLYVEELESYMHIHVSDTGVGIDKEQLAKIFDRFHQADSSATRQYEGTGIGLSLAQEFVKLHGGDISVESEVGKGTRFEFTIPILDRTDAVDVVRDETQDAITSFVQSFMQEETEVDDGSIIHSLGRPKVLVVEDNADMRWYLNSILSRYYEVVLAEDGEQGLEKAMEHSPSLIVSDVMMPKMDGMELCNRLKQDERTSHIPLILLTAKASREHKLSGLSIGADDCLGKPFDREELEVRIANLIAIRKKLVEKFSSEPEAPVQELATTELDAEFLSRANEIIQQNLANGEFKSAQFVKEMGMSRTLVHNKMKALAGQTTSEFIKSMRLKKAAEIIKTTDEPLAQIGYLVGFNNPSYFSTSFSKMFGVSPSEYQKKIRV